MHVNNFLYKNESPNLRRVCAPDSELPSYTCTMSYHLTAITVFFKAIHGKDGLSVGSVCFVSAGKKPFSCTYSLWTYSTEQKALSIAKSNNMS